MSTTRGTSPKLRLLRLVYFQKRRHIHAGSVWYRDGSFSRTRHRRGSMSESGPDAREQMKDAEQN
jgi:hypothetical protein